MLSVKGHILNIQHFCTSDGPGIRTTVFMKGCPLHCVWCHNPETHKISSELLFRHEKCRLCGACIPACPQGVHAITKDARHPLARENCIGCGKCADACHTGALELAGKVMTAQEVLDDLLSDRIFYETSHGGITLSGGEPTAQPDFAEALLRACQTEGLHTAMETSGVCSRETLLRLVPHTDLFLLDWKLYDDTLHKKYTGVSNRTVLETLKLLDASQNEVHLRCPLIPTINTTQAHYESIAALSVQYPCIKRITLEPYHPLGIGKTEALGKEPLYQNREFMDKALAKEILTTVQQKVSIPVNLGSE